MEYKGVARPAIGALDTAPIKRPAQPRRQPTSRPCFFTLSLPLSLSGVFFFGGSVIKDLQPGNSASPGASHSPKGRFSPSPPYLARFFRRNARHILGQVNLVAAGTRVSIHGPHFAPYRYLTFCPFFGLHPAAEAGGRKPSPPRACFRAFPSLSNLRRFLLRPTPSLPPSKCDAAPIAALPPSPSYRRRRRRFPAMSNQEYYGGGGYPQHPQPSYGPPQGNYGPPQGYNGGYQQGQPPMQYQQAPPPNESRGRRGGSNNCLMACLAALCCCCVAEEGCECCLECCECLC
ncbi:hypothetical protein XA68_13777 [Ophiocordyceps unilateralis]|uniref:Cysteine-rich transmembrane domain-containing protein n=1 Tax=Ophiocordyceps unilateralis TaxID=268505 RepID=A0A2A9PTY9_OPHUN|nr:hypothetical protein XA68_13777 [Ophiocordyceps unilateralis]